MAASDSLALLMQTLPQELFDKIYNDAFTVDGVECVIDKDYKPLAQPQIDRVSREMFATSYYGNGATLTFPSGIPRGWLESLPAQHFDKIEHFECWIRKSTHPELRRQVYFERRKKEKRKFYTSLYKHGYRMTGGDTSREYGIDHFRLDDDRHGNRHIKWCLHVDEEAREYEFVMVWRKISV